MPVYQSFIEKTRGLAFRTQAIGAAMEKATVESNKPVEVQTPVQGQVQSQPAVVEGAR